MKWDDRVREDISLAIHIRFAVFHMSEQVQQTAQISLSHMATCAASSLFTGDLTVRDVLSRSELYLTSPIRANFHSLRPVPAPPSGGATGVARESAGKKKSS